ncbi:folate receptor gamma-like [Elysia marginata]|uniref:Folate receptor gamma-like n=1 Tax=Elysia marginata TaxID=1093978 RepID=A0AAV4FHP3_9GAST|nr:folate receptor gamma-like [Elysia marginata]
MRRFAFSLLLISFLIEAGFSRLNNLNTVENYMNICMLGMHHKSSPSPEKGLTSKICSPWAARSCCTEETALDIHTDPTWLNFDWNHCGSLSPSCREYFIMDSCFYSCSPNVGPWLVEDVRKIRKERFKDVPLCKPECDNWYDACKDDLTCINKCPQGSTCKKFSEIYENSSSLFCEKVFGSFKVVDDVDNCFHLWFDAKYPNPNEAVARRRASEILNVKYEHVEGAKLTDHNKAVSSCSVWELGWMLSMLLLVAVL